MSDTKEKLAEELFRLSDDYEDWKNWKDVPNQVREGWLRVAEHVLGREEALGRAVGVCQANAELLWGDTLLTADQRFYIAKISDAATNALSAEKPESK